MNEGSERFDFIPDAPLRTPADIRHYLELWINEDSMIFDLLIMTAEDIKPMEAHNALFFLKGLGNDGTSVMTSTQCNLAPLMFTEW